MTNSLATWADRDVAKLNDDSAHDPRLTRSRSGQAESSESVHGYENRTWEISRHLLSACGCGYIFPATYCGISGINCFQSYNEFV